VADYKYKKPSTIAVARNRNTSLTITNFVTLSYGTVVGGLPVDPTKLGPTKNGLDAAGEPITITKFNSEFNDVEAGGDLLIPTGMPRWPVRLFGDYVKNTDADSGDDQGFHGGLKIGTQKDPLDFAFTYAYQRLETDAVVSAFSDSDFGRDGGTNTKAHILQAGLVLNKYLSLVSTAWIDKPIDEVEGRNPETDYRWQVDFVGKF
jgi:hypothetical protein